MDACCVARRDAAARVLGAQKPRCRPAAVQAIRRDVRLVAQYPEIGRPAPEMPTEFRERFVPFGDSGYLVLYRYDREIIALLAIRHAREAGYREEDGAT